MKTPHRHHRLLVAAAATLVLFGLGAGPSAARPDPGPPTDSASDSVPSQDRCLLERVGRQFIRCDDLAGNGVPAPTWILER
jgi:hypothetical protein